MNMDLAQNYALKWFYKSIEEQHKTFIPKTNPTSALENSENELKEKYDIEYIL